MAAGSASAHVCRYQGGAHGRAVQRSEKTEGQDGDKPRQFQWIEIFKQVVMQVNSVVVHKQPVSLVQSRTLCLHCQQPLLQPTSAQYCCHGCETAHQWIAQLGLEGFYRILADQKQSIARAEEVSQDYDLYDDPLFQKEFVTAGSDGAVAHGLVDGLTCYACVWLIEKAVKAVEPEAGIRINLTSGQAQVSFPSEKSDALSRVVRAIDRLGYRFMPHRDVGVVANSNGGEIIRMGVALFCFANVMLLTTAEYLSPVGELRGGMFHLFRGLSAALASISLFYGGRVFFGNSLRALRARRLSIDFSIAAALVAAYSYSLWQTVQGEGHVYFDSIAAVVALLLVGRFFQNRMLERTQRRILGYHAVNIDLVRVVPEGQTSQLKKIIDLQAGEEFLLRPGDTVPVNARLCSEDLNIHYADMTGEMEMRPLVSGGDARAGATVMDRPSRWRALQNGRDSYLLRAREAAEKMAFDKGRYAAFSETVSSTFTAVVLVLAVVVFVAFARQSLDEAFRRAMATLLISCACAFGFGTPLVFARAAWLGLRRGVAFRSQRAIESLASVRDIYWDKTGTLTKGQTHVVRFWPAEPSGGITAADYTALVSAAMQSGHHAVKAVGDWAQKQLGGVHTAMPVDLVEVFGQGVSFRAKQDGSGEETHRLGRTEFVAGAHLPGQIMWSRGGTFLGAFELGDSLFPESAQVVASLKDKGLRQAVLSGDGVTKTRELAASLGIDWERAEGQVSPSGKAGKITQVERQRPVLMIGNGVNDSLALAKSSVGMVVKGASDAAMRSADICLLRGGVAPVWSAFQLAWSTRRALQRCLIFAVIYNIVGLALAVFGAITPVVAALLMPISSGTVLLLATRWSPGKELEWKSSIF